MKSVILMLGLPLFLTACGTVRPAPPPKAVPCPLPPVLDAPPSHVLEQDFLKRMESFLQGKLPEPTKPEPSSNNATTNTKP